MIVTFASGLPCTMSVGLSSTLCEVAARPASGPPELLKYHQPAAATMTTAAAMPPYMR